MFADLREVKLCKLVQPGLAHVGDVQVTDFAPGFLVYVIDVLLHPIQIVERRFVVGGHNGHVARAGISRLGIDAQDHLFVCGANECVVKIRQRGDWGVVDRQNIIAGFHVHADIGERRAGFFIPVFAWQNTFDAISARGRVARKLRTKQAKFDTWSIGALTAGNVGVAVVQLANKLA